MAAEFPKAALLSVADHSGIVELAQGLQELGYRILSSGGTSATLKEAGIQHEDVTELTGQPDICGGRVRLIHPRLFAGLIAERRDGDQMRDLDREKIPVIDLAAVNLYPLANIPQLGDSSKRDILDFLDVSGSALLRAAARNYPSVITLCDPNDYMPVLDTLKKRRRLPIERSQSLAAKAFYYVSYYDSTIAQYLSSALKEMPDEMVLALKKSSELRAGENPHQRAALYDRSGSRPWGLNAAELFFGKPLSYNHYIGMDRAVELAAEFAEPACAIVIHGNPAGAAAAEHLGLAAQLAYRADPRGCTGGVAAFNREVNGEAASALAAEYLECIVAPDFSGEALDILRAKKNVRLVRLPSLLLSPNEIDIKTISGGVLLQDRDNPKVPEMLKTVTRRAPSELETPGLRLAWKVCKHTATHAAVFARSLSTVGIAAGQATRLDAVRLAIVKSQERHPVISPNDILVFASDSGLGPDHLQEAADAGATACIQPGGTSADREAVQLADELNMAMVFTGIRHHRH
ncbi:MAG: bifunctional phosphoribosylaminoimidazolecarboxamide formyltransferase/IMP cyclohydrolase [Elusimicrobiota bacterium]